MRILLPSAISGLKRLLISLSPHFPDLKTKTSSLLRMDIKQIGALPIFQITEMILTAKARYGQSPMAGGYAECLAALNP